MKIYVAIANTGTIKIKTALSLVSLALNNKADISFGSRASCDLIDNRNWLVNFALENGFTHILFVDSDMLFSGSSLGQLLAHDKDIVGAPYNKRNLSSQSVVASWGEKEMPVGPYALFKCKTIGMGFVLIRTSVFIKVGKPWFKFEYNEKGEQTMSEDAWFCGKARDAGFEVWCDPTIEVGHIGEYTY